MANDFNLSNTPNTSALILTMGEVQDNHARNFAGILRYGANVATVSTAALTEAMPTVGMPLSHGGFYPEMAARGEHRRNCASWIVDYAAKELDLEPYTYDVHLLDGTERAEGEPINDLTSHWHSVAGKIPLRPEAVLYQDDPGLLWKYRPFELTDTQLLRLGQEMPEEPTTRDYLNALQSSRLPVRFRYASATLLTPHGNLAEATVTFDYPTQTEFVRVERPAQRTTNADGDYVSSVTEVSQRTYRQPLTQETEELLKTAKAGADAVVEQAIQDWGDYDMFLVADDGTAEYNAEAVLAPVKNLI